MAWETRESGRYYYRSQRVNGHVVKRYVGAGVVAEAMADLDAMERKQREQERAKMNAQRNRISALDHRIGTLSRAVDAAVAQVLTAAGYHRHDRGAWRKRRKGQEQEHRMATELQIEAKKGELVAVDRPVVPATRQERAAVVSKALGSGNAEDEAHAIACLRAHPDEMLGKFTDMLEPIINQTAGSHKILRQAMENAADARRKMLMGPEATPLEMLLIERVVVCGLQLAYYERLIAKNSRKDVQMNQAVWMQKQADLANRRYLSAIKTLAQVQRLQVPLSVQVNIAAEGGQQVNVAGDLHPPPTSGGTPGSQQVGTVIDARVRVLDGDEGA